MGGARRQGFDRVPGRRRRRSRTCAVHRAAPRPDPSVYGSRNRPPGDDAEAQARGRAGTPRGAPAAIGKDARGDRRRLSPLRAHSPVRAVSGEPRSARADGDDVPLRDRRSAAHVRRHRARRRRFRPADGARRRSRHGRRFRASFSGPTTDERGAGGCRPLSAKRGGRLPLRAEERLHPVIRSVFCAAEPYDSNGNARKTTLYVPENDRPFAAPESSVKIAIAGAIGVIRSSKLLPRTAADTGTVPTPAVSVPATPVAFAVSCRSGPRSHPS